MKLLAFIGITVLAGTISGTIYGSLNLAAVEPFIDQAIEIENQNLMKRGEVIDWNEMNNYRTWQKGGSILAGAILGISYAAFYAIVYGYTRKALPGSSEIRKSLFLTLMIWATIFIIPFLKYPANPPAVGDPETIYYRQTLYLTFLGLSGIGALGFAFLYKKFAIKGKKLIIPAMYAAYMAGCFIAMPPNPDPIPVPMDLVTNFRIVSATTMTVFWIMLGIIFGTLWQKFRMHVGIRRAN
jgi:predicted cobalt transporter CbtA